MTMWTWWNDANDDTGAGDDFFGRICFARQSADVIAGSEGLAQTIQRFGAIRLE